MLKHLFKITPTYLICHKKISSHIDKKKHMLIQKYSIGIMVFISICLCFTRRFEGAFYRKIIQKYMRVQKFDQLHQVNLINKLLIHVVIAVHDIHHLQILAKISINFLISILISYQ